MSRLLRSLLILTLAAPAFAQQSNSTQRSPNQPQQPGSPATLRTGTKLVVVDIVVTDKKKKTPIHNLKASDFAVLENNVSQTVKTFEEHTALTPAAAAKIEPMPRMPTAVFTNFTPAPALANGPVNILLLDKLNTPLQFQSRLRSQILDYLKQAKPGTRTAIFGLTTRLTLLQGFTDDPELLKAVLGNKSKLKASPLLNDATGGGGGPQQMSTAITDWGTSDGVMGQQIALLAATAYQFESEIATYQLQDRAKYTLDAMNALARYLVGIPGRKNVLWFSGSFPLNILPDPDSSTPFMNVSDSIPEYRETISLLSRGQVAVYPIDARGLTILPNVSVAGDDGDGAKYVHNPTLLAHDLNAAMEATFEENSAMKDMAYQTGGRAFLNTNDLTEAVASALDEGANYYTLSYTPADTNWNGDFRKIQVQMQQQGLNLSYRRGYYADDLYSPPTIMAREGSGRAVTAPMPPPPTSGSMHLALMHGGPEPAEIVFSVHVLPMSNTTEDTLVRGNEGSKGLQGPYRRYALDIAADPRGLSFTRSADGIRHGSFEFVIFVYDTDGKLVNALGTPIKADLNNTLYLKVLQHGIPFHEEVSVPAKSEYFVRISVHDLQGDHVGAIEIPISSVHNLPPATAQASTSK